MPWNGEVVPLLGEVPKTAGHSELRFLDVAGLRTAVPVPRGWVA